MIVESNVFCLIFKNTNRFLFHIYSVSIFCRICTNEYGRVKFEIGFARHEERAREKERERERAKKDGIDGQTHFGLSQFGSYCFLSIIQTGRQLHVSQLVTHWLFLPISLSLSLDFSLVSISWAERKKRVRKWCNNDVERLEGKKIDMKFNTLIHSWWIYRFDKWSWISVTKVTHKKWVGERLVSLFLLPLFPSSFFSLPLFLHLKKREKMRERIR